MMYRLVLVLILVCSINILSGCWNQRELNELGIVSAIGIDKIANDKYNLSFQVVNTPTIAGENKGSGGGKPAFRVYEATGTTLFDALRKASKEAPRRLYVAHTNLIVIGEKLARDNIKNLLDLIERDAEFRAESIVIIAKGSNASDFLKVITSFENIPAAKVIHALQITEKVLGENSTVNVSDIIRGLVSSGKEPVISGFDIISNDGKGDNIKNTQSSQPKVTLRANGLGILKKGKLVGWLHKKEARGFMWVEGKLKSASQQVDWKNKKKVINIELLREDTKVDAKIKNNKIQVLIHVKAEGDIAEFKTPIDIMNPENISILEKSWRNEIKKEILQSIIKAQKEKTDIFGFGEVIHRKYPERWKGIKRTWNDKTFPKLDIEIQTKTFIRNTGVRANSYLLNIDK